MPPKRYYALRIISFTLKIFAISTVILSIYAAIRLNEGAPFPYTTLPALGVLVGGAVLAFFMWARSELIMVSIHTEENTRETAHLLRIMVERQHGEVPLGEDFRRSLNGVWDEPPQRIVPPRQGPPPPRRWIEEQKKIE